MLYLTVILMVAVFIVILNNSYAYFEEEVEGSCVTLEVGKLIHSLESKVTLKANEETKIEVVVKSNENTVSKYQVYYTSSSDLTNVVVGCSNKTANLLSGDIAKKEEKTITLILQNNSANEVTISIGAKGGLATNTIEDIILESDEYRVVQELEETKTIEDIVLANVDTSTTIDFSQISSASNGRGIYKYYEDGVDIYYWGGKV